MSNYLKVAAVLSDEMAAKPPEFGMDHPTTVPTNFIPIPDDDTDVDESDE